MKKTVGVKLDLNSIKLFEEKAKNEGKNKNQILKELISNYISDNTTEVSQVNQSNTQLSEKITTDSKKSQQSQTDISHVNLKKSKFTNEIATDYQKSQQLQETPKSEPQKSHKSPVESHQISNKNRQLTAEINKTHQVCSDIQDESSDFGDSQSNKITNESANNNKNEKFWKIFNTIAILGLVAVAGYFVYTKFIKKPEEGIGGYGGAWSNLY